MTRLAMESHPSRETLPSLPPVGTFTRGIVNAILTSNAPAFRPAPVAGRVAVSNAPAFRPAPVAGRARSSAPDCLAGPYARSGSRFRVLARDSERLVHFTERPVGVEGLTLAGEVRYERFQLLLVLAPVPP